MNTILKNKLLETLKFSSKEEKINFEAEKIHLDFMNFLSKKMQENNLTKKDLAKKLEISPSYLTQLFQAERLVNLKFIAKVQDFFDEKLIIVPTSTVLFWKNTYPENLKSFKINKSFLKGQKTA